MQKRTKEQRTAALARERRRLDIAKVYRAYCSAVHAGSVEADRQRLILMRLLKRLTKTSDDRQALEAGGRAARRKRCSTPVPEGSLPAIGMRTPEYRRGGGIRSVVTNNVGRGKRQ